MSDITRSMREMKTAVAMFTEIHEEMEEYMGDTSGMAILRWI